jgi:hypothetical protein
VSTIPVVAGQVYILYVDNFSSNGQAFNLTWQLSAGASLDCTVLPIELLSFKAEPGEHDVQLEWATATEQDNDIFIVERSRDGALFSPIGTVDAAGNSSEETHYAHLDAFPENGLNYYRLKQLDLNGQFTYSYIRSAFFRGGNGSLTLVPNPGSDVLRVLLSRAGTATVHVVDATGRLVLSMPASGGQVVLVTSPLPSGLYSVQALTTEGMLISSNTWVKE